MWLQGNDSKHHLRALFILFVAWKALVLVIALLSPGTGYDTSTSLLGTDSQKAVIAFDPPATHSSALLKLVRWDAIYFTQVADRGHVFEQEWAFGIGVSTVLSKLAHSGLLSRGKA